MRPIGLAVVLALGLVLAPLATEAQQETKVARIRRLMSGRPDTGPAVDPFVQALRDLGYVEDRNLVIEYRYADGKHEQFPALAAELAALKVDVIVVPNTRTALAAKQATSTIPIVFFSVSDPVGSGLVNSLARPGGNVTGSTFFVPELIAKRLELVKQAMPRAERVAVHVNADDPSHVAVLNVMETTAGLLKIEVKKFAVSKSSELESAMVAMAKSRMNAAVVQEDGLLTNNARAIADSAAKRQLFLAGNAKSWDRIQTCTLTTRIRT
jgi:putative ABC transport system substrate-binding protein